MRFIKLQQGVTLLELLITLAIAAILAAIGAPYMGGFVNDMRLSSTATQLMSDMNRARSEAIKRNRGVLVCILGGSTTTYNCAAGTNWQAGWLVCADEDSDNACDAPTPGHPNPLLKDQSIVVKQALNGKLHLDGTSPIRFGPNGTSSSAVNLTLIVDGGGTRTISVAATGNVSKTP